MCWQKHVAECSQVSNKPITKVNFAQIFNAAYIEACDPEVIKKFFECYGLYPFNPDKVDYSKCISYRRKLIKESNNSLEVRWKYNYKNVILLNVESNIPQSILDQFETAYQANKLPQTEIVLFNIWKKFKDASSNKKVDNILQNTCENLTVSKNQSKNISQENHPDKFSLNNEMLIFNDT